MKQKRKLAEFERYIDLRAKNLAYRVDDYDDFKQEGRLAAWKAMQQDPYATKSYIQQAIDWRLVDLARKLYNHVEEQFTSQHENILYGAYGEGEEN